MTQASNRAPVVPALLRAPARPANDLCALLKAPQAAGPRQDAAPRCLCVSLLRL